MLQNRSFRGGCCYVKRSSEQKAQQRRCTVVRKHVTVCEIPNDDGSVEEQVPTLESLLLPLRFYRTFFCR